MIRVVQLMKSRWLRLRKIRSETKRLEGERKLILSHRLVIYKERLRDLYLRAQREDNKSAQIYYLGQVALINWLLDKRKKDAYPVLKDAK